MDPFTALMNDLDYPLVIVTARAGAEADGCLVGFAMQASIEPARFLVGLSRTNRTFRIAAAGTHLGVHFPSVDDGACAELFGGETGDEIDKLARVAWHEGEGGAPLLEDVPNRFVGRILTRFSFGDHVGHLLTPVAVEYAGSERPFTFHRGKAIDAGHAP
jgi:flavin reductase (DIM6/NTAB) family NADH-FMN oxidoreductase RutF